MCVRQDDKRLGEKHAWITKWEVLYLEADQRKLDLE